ncbi:Do family serine endopeptidase [bacterium]|nr:Do family serine endopeptidase [candidate division CSSED10-310 bacterium]
MKKLVIIACSLMFSIHVVQAVRDISSKTQDTIESEALTSTTFRDIAGEASNSVVNISTTTVIKSREYRGRRQPSPFDDFFGDDFFRHFFEPRTQPHKMQSLGSGVIIDVEGHILTNNHVISDVDQITVTLLSGETYDAQMIGTDAETDIALIKIDPKKPVKSIPMGNSEMMMAGDWVMAIGNPFGFGHTVTVGVISATRRSMVMPRDELPYQDFIQTDASINPGNSGGPLLDIHGRLIGINTVIASRTGQSAGIGFAIPINMIKPLLKDLKEKGSVTRGWMGVTIQSITQDLSSVLNLESTEGALVAEIVEDGPAAKAGILSGDVIVSFNGTPVRDSSHLSQIVAATPVDETIDVVLIRDGKKKALKMTIGTRPGNALQVASGAGVSVDFGMTVQNITDDIAIQLQLDSTVGVLISEVEPGSPADTAGLRRGDIILEINRQAVRDITEYQHILKEIDSSDGAVVYIQRAKSRIFVALKPKAQ